MKLRLVLRLHEQQEKLKWFIGLLSSAITASYAYEDVTAGHLERIPEATSQSWKKHPNRHATPSFGFRCLFMGQMWTTNRSTKRPIRLMLLRRAL